LASIGDDNDGQGVNEPPSELDTRITLPMEVESEQPPKVE
jgi:hypothetical protein